MHQFFQQHATPILRLLAVVMLVQFALASLETAKPDVHSNDPHHSYLISDTDNAITDKHTADNCDHCCHCHGSHKLIVRNDPLLYTPANPEKLPVEPHFTLPVALTSIYRPPIA